MKKNNNFNPREVREISEMVVNTIKYRRYNKLQEFWNDFAWYQMRFSVLLSVFSAGTLIGTNGNCEWGGILFGSSFLLLFSSLIPKFIAFEYYDKKQNLI